MTHISRFIAPVLLLAVLLPLGGCVSMVVGAGATVGIAAMEERPFGVHTEDTTLASKIRYNLVEAGGEYMTSIGVEVYESRALLTGTVKDEAMRAEAVKLAWKVDRVKDVFNEIQISESGIANYAKDSWVTTQLKSKITFDQDVLAINYFIETVNGIVYLIGIAQNQKELDRVIAHARELGYVKRVISHVRVK